MRIFTTELRKLLCNIIFLLITAAVLVLNAYLMFKAANSGETTPSDYTQIFSEIESMTDSEKLEWLDKELNNFSGERLYSWDVISELHEECAGIVGYKDYIENIRSQAESMTSMSVFAKPDTFNYRSIVKTPPAYENMQDVQPVFDISKGIILATDNNFTDILCGFILLSAVMSLMISDRELGMSGLLFSLKKGRGHLMLAKTGVLAAVVFGAVLLIYAENLIISEYLYGLGDLSRPVQSLSGFIGCNLKISVFGYLILYIIFKFAAIFTVGAVLSLIAVNTKNIVSFYGISAVILTAEGIAYIKIHPLSVYSIFRYINLISFTKVNEIFSSYRNINFREYPVPLIPASAGAVAVISVICVSLSALLYAKKRKLEFRKLSIRFKTGKSDRVHSRIYYTLYKSLILQKGLIVIIVFFAVAGFMSEGFIKQYDVADVYYEYYTQQLKGEITQEKLDFIDSESKRFEEIQTKIDKLSQNGYSSELNELYKELAPSLGFYMLKDRVDKIKDIDGAQIFYDTGYKRALGIAGYDDDMKYALAAVLLCIFLISPLAANDRKYRMESVINSTKSGRTSYIRRSLIISALYGLFAALLWIIPYAVTIFRFYCGSGLSASVRSIADFAEPPVNMTVFQHIIMICILRTVFVIISSWIMLYISSKCRNTASAVLINFAVFALPVIVYLLGAKFTVNLGFNPFLSVNVLFNDFSVIQILIPAVTAVLIAIFNTLLIIYEKSINKKSSDLNHTNPI
ncbi:MAG: hypothetical protein ACI4I9_07070 [Porcipelethomonas sp.]